MSAGHDIGLCHGTVVCNTNDATVIPFTVFSNVDAFLRANMFGWDDNHVMSSPDSSGRIDEHTDGPIVDTETTATCASARSSRPTTT